MDGAVETWHFALADEAATRALARRVADLARVGDFVELAGPLGVGKTAFARELVRALAGDDDLEVPSPTFTLMQDYEGLAFPVLHADFYRIRDAAEVAELGFAEAADGALAIVEWADRGPRPADRLEIAFGFAGPVDGGARTASLRGHGDFAPRLAMARDVETLVERSGWAEATREPIAGDASSRAYWRLRAADGRTAVLMVAPARGGEAIVRFGRSYSQIARLAQDVRAFVAVDGGLRERGFSAPEVHAADLAGGVAIIEDLGGEFVAQAGAPVPARYAEAVNALARLHGMPLPGDLPLPDGTRHPIPPYDLDAMLVEVELALEWYAPHVAGARLSSGAKAVFLNLWRYALSPALDGEKSWTMRDWHSPNLMWLPAREGYRRIGIIDFQDCVIGPTAYDLASLLQDARVDVPDALELKLLSLYSLLRAAGRPDFDRAAFAQAYSLMAAQRATKLLGIFTRLARRDGKPQYREMLPRVRRYLGKSLAHPALKQVADWYATHLPDAVEPPASRELER
ncbi:MAG: tRNA (adenosine(37)-N6)-threonylcarbamoyltransferase complex ATPase subunit type 1 TsaE [Hyphomicrobiales bacterium]|nr:tRNA (adenosine(37)-N6)-threonylcarbamoyltransferase complex ATPase subunit type 1 TsaE [Hyphomicrobiales bacterium]